MLPRTRVITASTMAVAMAPTPSVSIDLDDSEMMRLEKLRSRLKLTHWTKIERKNNLKADDDVAKMIEDMKTNDTVVHDDMYADWSNRYSDFTMDWKRIKSATTGEIEGHLVAMGRPRFSNLGRIGKGCMIDLMFGPILDQPLPTTRVGNLRINHLQFEIRFDLPTKFRDEEVEDSTFFKVGHKNELYGTLQRESNRNKFNKKKA